MIELRRIGRQGTSICLTLPPAILRTLGWERGDLVALAPIDGRLAVVKFQERHLWSQIQELADALPDAKPKAP